MAVALVWFGFAAIAFIGLRIGDEWVHYEQISRFRTGQFSDVVDSLTTFPGYHAVVAAVMWLFGAESLGAARFVNIAFGAVAVVMFFELRRELHPADAARATIQFSVCPPIFVYVFLAYTDVPSLTVVLAASLATIKRAHVLSALLLLAAISLRQNNVVWGGMLGLLAGWPMLTRVPDQGRQAIRELVAVCWPYLLPAIAFACLWAWRGSISYSAGQAPLHPDLQANLGNIVFALFLICLLLPFQILIGARDFLARARTRAWLWLLPIVAGVGFVTLFKVDHPFNHVALHYNPRNALLVAASQPGSWAWIAFGASALLAMCGMAGTRLARPEMKLLVPFSAIFLAGSWLIETRYMMIPLALWLASREPSNAAIERTTTALWLITAVYLSSGVFAFRFMI